MEIILDRNQYDGIWNKIYDEFLFSPSCKAIGDTWLYFPIESKKYRLNGVFSEEEERIVNSIFCRVHGKDMYALDWRHDCFIYNPCEEIPLDDWFYDTERNCNVYFPSYYPDGDYHFFASFDWSIGLYGHPWQKELIVVGEKLIREFEKSRDMLAVTE